MKNKPLLVAFYSVEAESGDTLVCFACQDVLEDTLFVGTLDTTTEDIVWIPSEMSEADVEILSSDDVCDLLEDVEVWLRLANALEEEGFDLETVSLEEFLSAV